MTGRAFRKLSDMGVSGASLVALKGVMPHLIHACGAMHSPRGVSHTPLTLVSDPSSAASLPAGAFATPPSMALAPWSVAKSERSDSSSRASGSDSLTALQVHDTCELEITIVCGADTHTQACTAQTPPQRCTFTQGVCREIDDEYGSARSIDEKMLQGAQTPCRRSDWPRLYVRDGHQVWASPRCIKEALRGTGANMALSVRTQFSMCSGWV